jgi:hypothetical protein
MVFLFLTGGSLIANNSVDGKDFVNKTFGFDLVINGFIITEM